MKGKLRYPCLMGTNTGTLTDFLREPKKVLRMVDKQDVVLRRRNKPSLRLSLESRNEGSGSPRPRSTPVRPCTHNLRDRFPRRRAAAFLARQPDGRRGVEETRRTRCSSGTTWRMGPAVSRLRCARRMGESVQPGTWPHACGMGRVYKSSVRPLEPFAAISTQA